MGQGKPPGGMGRHIAFYKGEDRLVKSLALSYLLLFLYRSLKQVDEEKDEVGG